MAMFDPAARAGIIAGLTKNKAFLADLIRLGGENGLLWSGVGLHLPD
jgi:hypothetical protein